MNIIKKMHYILAIPYNNYTNKYITFLLLKIFNLKLVKNFNDYIKKILDLYTNKTYIFPKNITKIENYAFCFGVFKEVIIPDTVVSIGSYAFLNCLSLEKVIIPNTVVDISSYAFWNCCYLEQIVISKKHRFNLEKLPI